MPQVAPGFDVAGRPHAGGRGSFGAWADLSSLSSRRAAPAAGGFHDGEEDWRNRRCTWEGRRAAMSWLAQKTHIEGHDGSYNIKTCRIMRKLRY